MKMRLKNQKQQTGMALFQVLLITAVISILALQFTQTAKNQIAIARLLDDRIKAHFLLATTESELLFSLFTKPKNQSSDTRKDKFSTAWNFHGEEFTLSTGAKITLQDQNSLVSLFRARDKAMITRLINSFNLPGVSADVVSNSLIDWQDEDNLVLVNGAEAKYYNKIGMPSNMPLQSMSELSQVKGVTPALVKALKPYTTIRSQGYFNPLNSPKHILALLIDNIMLEKVIELRQNRELTSLAFERITTIAQDEGIHFSSSGALKIQIKISYNDIILTKESEVFIEPYQNQPFIEYLIKY